MKATINSLGRLEVTAENGLESYALRKWVDENFDKCSCQIKGKSFIVDLGHESLKEI